MAGGPEEPKRYRRAQEVPNRLWLEGKPGAQSSIADQANDQAGKDNSRNACRAGQQIGWVAAAGRAAAGLDRAPLRPTHRRLPKRASSGRSR